ncbi:MAG: hypothetical protein ACLR8R_10220 [Oscillospiraceae bacterium]
MKFAEKVKSRKTKHEAIHKSRLAEKLVLRSALSSVMKKGQLPPERETYAALANALDVETNYLLTEDEEFVVNC